MHTDLEWLYYRLADGHCVQFFLQIQSIRRPPNRPFPTANRSRRAQFMYFLVIVGKNHFAGLPIRWFCFLGGIAGHGKKSGTVIAPGPRGPGTRAAKHANVFCLRFVKPVKVLFFECVQVIIIFLLYRMPVCLLFDASNYGTKQHSR